MKILILLQSILFTLLGIQLSMLPSLPPLLVALVSVMVLDLVTGIVKAKFKNVARTSEGMRRTVAKFIQYFTAIVIAVGLQYLLRDIDEATKANISYLARGLVVFIILIEIFSCCENIYEVDSNSMFSRFVVKPILKIMSFGFKNNPLLKKETEIDATENHKNLKN